MEAKQLVPLAPSFLPLLPLAQPFLQNREEEKQVPQTHRLFNDQLLT